jgi:hypothetical protein
MHARRCAAAAACVAPQRCARMQLLRALMRRIEELMHMPVPAGRTWPPAAHRGGEIWPPEAHRATADANRAAVFGTPPPQRTPADVPPPLAMAPADLSLLATAATIGNCPFALWRGGDVPCHDATDLARLLASETVSFLRLSSARKAGSWPSPSPLHATLNRVPDALFPPWLKLLFCCCDRMHPMHVLALVSAATAQLPQGASGVVLEPQEGAPRRARRDSVHNEPLRSFAVAERAPMAPVDTAALRAGVLTHVLAEALRAFLLRDTMRTAAQACQPPEAPLRALHAVLLDFGALAWQLAMRAGESDDVVCVATAPLMHALLDAARVPVHILRVVPSAAHRRGPGKSGKAQNGGAARTSASLSLTPAALLSIADAATKRFSQMRLAVPHSPTRGVFEAAALAMSGTAKGLPEWQAYKRGAALGMLRRHFERLWIAKAAQLSRAHGPPGIWIETLTHSVHLWHQRGHGALSLQPKLITQVRGTLLRAATGPAMRKRGLAGAARGSAVSDATRRDRAHACAGGCAA